MIFRKHRLVQAACFVAACVLLWPLPFWTSAPKLILQLSPFIAVCDSLALRSITAGTAIGLLLAAFGVFRRRWFCRYACPVGFLLDGISSIGLKKTAWWARWMPLGRHVAWLTIGGAAAGYPFLLWMDPLAIFSSSFAVRASGGVLAGILAGLGIGMLLLLAWTSGAFWCVRLCPLGGLLDLLASLKDRLKASREASTQTEGASRGRRIFLVVIAGAGLGLLARWGRAARREEAPLRPPGAVPEREFTGLCLRCGNCVRLCPSSIIRQDRGETGIMGFLAPVVAFEKNYCSEDCSACTKVCPSGALRALSLEQKRRYPIGEALPDLPICVLALGERDCDACRRACPYDAIRIHWDEEQSIAYPVVDREKCNGCGACEVACPTRGSKAIRVWKRLTIED